LGRDKVDHDMTTLLGQKISTAEHYFGGGAHLTDPVGVIIHPYARRCWNVAVTANGAWVRLPAPDRIALGTTFKVFADRDIQPYSFEIRLADGFRVVQTLARWEGVSIWRVDQGEGWLFDRWERNQ
jgi:hypothetical protein